MTPAALRVIASMATRAVLAEIEVAAAAQGLPAQVESVGGVDAARRVAHGESFDLVVLADAAVGLLEEGGHVRRGSRVAIAESNLVAAVACGRQPPHLGTDEAARASIGAADAIGYSTGPSGEHLLRVLERWHLLESLASRLVQAPPGVPVGRLLADGAVTLGFQQASELIGMPGLVLIDALAPTLSLTTRFSGAICVRCMQPDAAATWLAYAASNATAAIKRRRGMRPVGGGTYD